MPDGDKVQSEVGGEYRKAYQQICEGKATDEDLAIGLIAPTIKKIQEYGDEPIQLIAEVAKICEDIQGQLPLFKDEIDWADKFQQVEALAQHMCMNKRAKNLAVRACEDQIKALYDGQKLFNIHLEMINGYFWRIYRADFESYVESAPDHFRDASRAVVNARLERMRPSVRGRLIKVAEQTYHQNTVTSLRQPPRYAGKSKGVPLDSNLLYPSEV